jgi:hypothetical protein
LGKAGGRVRKDLFWRLGILWAIPVGNLVDEVLSSIRFSSRVVHRVDEGVLMLVRLKKFKLGIFIHKLACFHYRRYI